ncbi:LysR family transcriptional regulator [Sulfuricaulis limicola]|uniref:LysR family transcriptional regulator n=1 Tax=Sulfuricaulis limicola TaxID=1620215 RepID=A0A1B4XCA4_9GAMM|nr:hydrogen peroxide-inducible genes activator [Sulfuricaulis limicola]BAV32421.1 LysR family transcriptional regulator [Sulfuricaulis limicola]
MNLRDLKYFIMLAETRHFGQAAARSFVSQPTLSGQIKKLEDELGVALFERTKKHVALTPLGEALLPHARRAVEEAEALAQLARASQDPLAGSLRLGVIPTLSPYLMPLVLAPLRRQHPQLKLVLTEELTEHLLERLHRHEIDAALIATTVKDAELATRVLFDEPFWLAIPRKHPLYDKDSIVRRDLAQLDLLLLSEGHCLAEQAMEVCHLRERAQTGEQADLRAASLDTLLQLVGAGMGATLVPALALRSAAMTGSGVVTRQLEVPDAYRRVSLVWRRSFPRTAAVEALAGVILAQLPNTVRVAGAARRDTRSTRPRAGARK